MDAPARTRDAALMALAEIEPDTLRTELQEIITDASMVPAVVAVRTAERLTGREGEQIAIDRGVGVQLSYEGLRLTRELIREEEQYDASGVTASYLSLVGAEVLVSRGFEALAETPVAHQAIEIVQRFARNQTLDYRENAEAGTAGRSLEWEAISLAVAAGASTAVEPVPAFLTEFGENLAAELDSEPFPHASGVDMRIRSGLEAAVAADDAVMVND